MLVAESRLECVLNLTLQRVNTLANQFSVDDCSVKGLIVGQNGEETRVFVGGKYGARQGQRGRLVPQFALNRTSKHLLVNTRVHSQLLARIINEVGEVLDERLELDEVIQARIRRLNLRNRLEVDSKGVSGLELGRGGQHARTSQLKRN